MLRRRLIVPAAATALALSLGLTAIGFLAGRTIVQVMADHLIREVTQAVHRDVVHIIGDVDRALSRVANDFARHDVPLGDPLAVARELYGLLAAERDLDWLYFGNEAGGIVSVGRLADGTTVFLMTDGFRAGIMREFEALPNGGIGRLRKSAAAFDTRQKSWYTRAKETRKPYWTELYLVLPIPSLGVSLATPVFDKDGSFVGVFGTDLILTQLADLMRTLHVGDDGRTFLVDAAGRLIASSGGVLPVSVGADGRQVQLNAVETADPVVRSTAGYLSRHPEIVKQASAGLQSISFDDAGLGPIYAAVDRFQAPGGIDWIIVSALPAENFLRPVRRAAYFSLATGASIVVAAFLLGLWSIGAALRPLTALTKVTQAIARGEWRDVPETRRNDEIGVLANAFSVMAARLKKTLDGLRDREATLEEAQRIAHLGYWDHDLDTDLRTWSDETYRIFGLAPQERTITSAAWQDLVHPEDRRMVNQAVAEALRGGSRYDVDYRVVRPDGAVRVVHSQGDVTRDELGRPCRIFGTVQDITERKQAEEDLRESERRYREAQMELAHANRVATVGQLSASIAHELNQPLGAILSNTETAELMLGSPTPNLEEIKTILADVRHADVRASEIIDRLRRLLTKSGFDARDVDLNKIAREVLGIMAVQATAHAITLISELSPLPLMVKGDRVQLEQVVLNLVANAIEALAGTGQGNRQLTVRTTHLCDDSVPNSRYPIPVQEFSRSL